MAKPGTFSQLNHWGEKTRKCYDAFDLKEILKSNTNSERTKASVLLVQYDKEENSYHNEISEESLQNIDDILANKKPKLTKKIWQSVYDVVSSSKEYSFYIRSLDIDLLNLMNINLPATILLNIIPQYIHENDYIYLTSENGSFSARMSITKKPFGKYILMIREFCFEENIKMFLNVSESQYIYVPKLPEMTKNILYEKPLKLLLSQPVLDRHNMIIQEEMNDQMPKDQYDRFILRYEPEFIDIRVLAESMLKRKRRVKDDKSK